MESSIRLGLVNPQENGEGRRCFLFISGDGVEILFGINRMHKKSR
jgi:hypothetical protein